MENIIELLTNNPWLNILFLILAVVGIFATIYTYVKSRKTSKPTFASSNFNIVSSKLSRIENLSIQYDKAPIEELSVCQFIIYNAGKKSIRRDDIAPKDKIRINLVKGKILSCKIKFCKKEINNIHISISKNSSSILISFDFLGYFDGAVIQFFHTEKEPQNIRIAGTIIDSGKFLHYSKRFKSLRLITYLQKYFEKGMLPFLLRVILLFPVLVICILPAIYKLIVLRIIMPKEYIIK